MILSDENYYLAAYYGETGEIRHYRVDKIKDLELLEDQPREGQKAIAQLDIPKYANMHFGMFNGEQTDVELKISQDKVAYSSTGSARTSCWSPTAGPGAADGKSGSQRPVPGLDHGPGDRSGNHQSRLGAGKDGQGSRTDFGSI